MLELISIAFRLFLVVLGICLIFSFPLVACALALVVLAISAISS